MNDDFDAQIAEKRRVVEQLRAVNEKLRAKHTMSRRQLEDLIELEEEEDRLKKENWKLERGYPPNASIETPYDDSEGQPQSNAEPGRRT